MKSFKQAAGSYNGDVVLPAGYQVVQVGFQAWVVYAPDNTEVGQYASRKAAANRALRHQAGLTW
jgi:hypothetical protein